MNRFTLFALTVPMLGAGPAQAQSIWQSPGQPSRFGLEILTAELEDEADLDFPSSTVTFSVHQRLTDNIIGVFEIPVATLNTEFVDTDSKVGNPYFGIETVLAEPRGTFLEAGFRPDLGDHDLLNGGVMGLLTHQDQWEGFLDVTTFTAAVNGVFGLEGSPNSVRVRVGPLVWMPEDGGDPEIWGQASVQARVEGAGGHFLGGVASRFILTEDTGQDTFFELGLQGAVHSGPFRPGLQFKLPLNDDILGVVSFVWGFQVEFLPGG